MLKAETAVLDRFKHTPAEADLRVHHVLFNVDYRKALFARDSGDHRILVCVGGCHDHRSGIGRLVGVSDVYRDPFAPYGEDRVLVEYHCAHV